MVVSVSGACASPVTFAGTLDEEELIIVTLLSLAVISVVFGHNDYAILLLAGIFAVNIIRGK